MEETRRELSLVGNKSKGDKMGGGNHGSQILCLERALEVNKHNLFTFQIRT